jgi:hypothetical protein
VPGPALPPCRGVRDGASERVDSPQDRIELLGRALAFAEREVVQIDIKRLGEPQASANPGLLVLPFFRWRTEPSATPTLSARATTVSPHSTRRRRSRSPSDSPIQRPAFTRCSLAHSAGRSRRTARSDSTRRLSRGARDRRRVRSRFARPRETRRPHVADFQVTSLGSNRSFWKASLAQEPGPAPCYARAAWVPPSRPATEAR